MEQVEEEDQVSFFFTNILQLPSQLQLIENFQVIKEINSKADSEEEDQWEYESAEE